MIRRARMLNMLKVLTLDREQGLRTHGVVVRVIACIGEDIVETGNGGEEDPQRTFTERRMSSCFEKVAIAFTVWTHLAFYIISSELDQSASPPFRFDRPNIALP